jgi:hypothetical protein
MLGFLGSVGSDGGVVPSIDALLAGAEPLCLYGLFKLKLREVLFPSATAGSLARACVSHHWSPAYASLTSS